MKLRLITPPTEQVVTTAEAKDHMRVDTTDDDTIIDLMIQAATAHLDGQYGMLQRALNTQTWELVMDEFPDADCEGEYWVEIPLPPLQEIVSVKYYTSDVLTTMDSDDYEVDDVRTPARIRPVGSAAWPSTDDIVNAVIIRFTCGWEEESGASGVPEPIKAAIKLMVADMYDNRESVTQGSVNKVDIPLTVQRLLNQYRIHVFA